MHLEVESTCESLTSDALLVTNDLYKPVVDDLHRIRLIKLKRRHEDLPTLCLVLPEGVRNVEDSKTFILLEDIPCLCDIGGTAANPDLVGFIFEWTLDVLEYFDY